MRRNVKKTIEKGQKILEKNERRDLYCKELDQLLEMAKAPTMGDTLFNAITYAFEMGVAVGSGIEADRMKKLDCVTYYKVCKELNLPLEHYLEQGATV